MNKNIRPNFILVLIPLLLILYQIFISIHTAYISDALIKMIQVMSLVKNSWASENIVYPAISIDPNFMLSPFNDGFIFQNNGRLIGNYPIAISLMYSFLAFIPFQFMLYFNVIFLYLFILLLYKNFIKVKTIAFGVLCTIVFPLLVDFSENGFFLVLGSYGYVYLWKAHKNDKLKYWLLGNIFLGLSVWFRLEGILFFVAIQVSVLYREYVNKKSRLIHLIEFKRYFGFLVLVALFFGWNYYSYSHLLGPRYLATFTHSEKTFLSQIQIFISMLFTFPKEGGFAFGFFLLSPILLYALVKEFQKNYQEKSLSFHSAVSIVFIFLVGFTSPNDGITLTGRYFLLAITPLVFILDEHLGSIESRKYLYRGVFIWNLLASTLVILTLYLAIIELEKVKFEIKKIDSSFSVTTNEFISSAFGLELFDKKVVCVRNKDLAPYFLKNAKDNALEEFTLITVKKENKYNSEEFVTYNELINRSSDFGYICEGEMPLSKLKTNRCFLKK